MKVTRPGSITPSMGGGDGRYPPSPHGIFAYGKDAGHRRAPNRDHQVDIDTSDVPDTVDEAPYHTPDMANVLGIPDNQVTPAVEQAIGRLMVRINGLNENLSDLKQRQAHLARNEGRDPFTGAISRPAFLQILENEMSLVGRDRTSRMLLMCELANLDEILQRHGQDCKEGLFNYVRRIMADFIMSPHHLGYLGCNDFAALMYNVDEEDVWQRVDAVTRWLDQHPFIHNDQPISVVPVFGLHHAQSGDTSTSALNAADAALRAHKEMYLAQLARIPHGI
ncbi:diguanylate cyclase domain-containing protein [Thalassospira sp. HJ]|uniref:GGDEF domain-containing protein n=1 Tax=Thalassospira sp. HJ TaxID=1616823 RepID=UPI000AC4277C|nr:diguanylate cyclase [Thalassospira sp. HJ]